MKQELNRGEIVEVKNFSFVNTAGGTGMSNWQFNEKFEGMARVFISERWDDYETGEGAIGVAVSPDLMDYLDRNANTEDRRVFISEFDLA